MTESIRQGTAETGKVIMTSNTVRWRLEANLQQEVALELAKEYQAMEKTKRAREHNELLPNDELPEILRGENEREGGTRPESTEQGHKSSDVQRDKSSINEGDQV